MQELLFGSWGPQIVSISRQVIAYSVQHPWRVFAAVLVVGLLADMMFRKRSSSDGGDFGGLGFGDGDGDGDGCGD